MNQRAAPAAGGDEDWFAEWFGDEYLELYGYRDEGEAARAVELVVRSAAEKLDTAVLDLACGAGRHLAYLRDAGLNAFGLDLSAPLLRRARQRGLPVVRGDMRELPFATGSLGLVTSFFTSFGYFPDPADDVHVLREVHRVLRPGGAFAVDYLNADAVREDLRPIDESELDGRRVVQTRTLIENDTVVLKRIEIFDDAGGPPRVFHERVRLYTADELGALLTLHGMQPVASFGDYRGGPLRPEGPRVILIGRSR
ncbi:MAG TPA: class I SAM-dependent methyltransferase [Longimicrobiaceae bacterium]|nr:class I SAM-dependent methyltransferase [Longimicrobiaceae bacterium]